MSDTGDYGGKAVIAGVSRGYPRDDLETKSLGSVDKSRAVAEVCLPGRIGESLSDITLDGAVYVGKGQIYVGTFGESVVVNCRDGDFLTRNLRQFGNRNTMRLQFTSVTNSVYLDFVDEFGNRRELSGIGGDCSFEDGDRELLQFERPFWAGEYDDVYRLPSSDEDFGDLPFTPTDFGEEALRALFGFVREARAQPSDLDPTVIMMHGFRVLPLREPDATESEISAPVPPPPPIRRKWWRPFGSTQGNV